jgi:gas vesicle protein
MREREGFSGRQLVIAVACGAALGAVVALLYTPESGRELRSRLRRLAARSRVRAGRVPEAFEEASEAARDAFVGALGKV